MKIIAFGDIHGRLDWFDIYQMEKPDLVIFMGDYVSTHDPDITSEQQCCNLEDILNFKEENPDKVILLRGNHDMQHLGYYWAQCSGFDAYVARWMSTIRDRFLRLTQWVHIQDGIVFSHAGISKVWWDTLDLGDPTLDNILKINNLPPSDLFGFTSYRLSDYCGDSETQPLTWIRPYTVTKYGIKGLPQVVGHTRIDCDGDVVQWLGDKVHYEIAPTELWCIDKLPMAYFVMGDGKKELRFNKLLKK